jgi:hypothetical protein
VQFGFSRRVTVSGGARRSQGSVDEPEALPQPLPVAADDTPLALGQVRSTAHPLAAC